MFRRLDNRIKVLLGTQGVFQFYTQMLAQYNALYARVLGATGENIGLLNSISSAVQGLASPFIGLTVEKYSLKAVLLSALVVETVAMTIFASAQAWYMLIPAYILAIMLVKRGPLADIAFVTFTKPSERGTVMGLSRAIWGVLTICAPMVAALIVTYSGGINAQGIRPIYYVSIILLASIFLIEFRFLHDTKLNEKNENIANRNGRFSFLKDYLNFLKEEKALKYWIPIRVIRDGFHRLPAIFVPLWIVTVKGASAAVLGTITTVALVTSILVQVPVGRLADRIGLKKAYVILVPIYFLGMLTLVLASNFEHLVLAAVLGGVVTSLGGGIGGVHSTPLLALWWTVAPREGKGKLYGLEGVLTAISSIPTAFLGGLLWDMELKPLVLLIPAAIELLVIMPLVYIAPVRK